jgi:hypothetical protein
MQYLSVAAKADDKKAGMTIKEVGAFVQECMRQDIADDVPVRVVAGFRSQIQSLSVDGKRSFE